MWVQLAFEVHYFIKGIIAMKAKLDVVSLAPLKIFTENADFCKVTIILRLPVATVKIAFDFSFSAYVLQLTLSYCGALILCTQRLDTFHGQCLWRWVGMHCRKPTSNALILQCVWIPRVLWPCSHWVLLWCSHICMCAIQTFFSLMSAVQLIAKLLQLIVRGWTWALISFYTLRVPRH